MNTGPVRSSGTATPAPIRIWLWTVAAMILAMVVVGGATRLTESGLSITEWQPISGVIPPLTPEAWQAEFEKYKTIPQYSQLFPDMTLEGFKSIFYWEWAHRLLGRLIGVVVALPLAFFWLMGRLTRRLKFKLVGLLALGGLQGLIGWWMVKSGLSQRTEVSQYRLALHLVTASLTLALAVWFAESGSHRSEAGSGASGRRLRVTSSLIVLGVFIQLGLGALVAGLRAGRIYNTWPLMGGSFAPPRDELLFLQPLWRNLFENATTVQFDHRIMAYGLLALVLAHAIDARWTAPASRAADTAALLLLVILGQAVLGILTLLWSVPLDVALLHQAWAMVLLAVAVTHRCALRPVPLPEFFRSADLSEVIGYAGAATAGGGRR